METPFVRPGDRICAAADLPEKSSFKFRVLGVGIACEAFLIRSGGRVFAYWNRCAHMALSLDLEDNDFFTIDLQALVCKTHGAMYHPESGVCFSGPCRGASLEPVPVEIVDGEVVLCGDAPA